MNTQPELITKPNILEGSGTNHKPYRNSDGHINPFHYDEYHMGQTIGRNIEMMLANHTTEPCKYVIFVNLTTGERVQVNFPESWQ